MLFKNALTVAAAFTIPLLTAINAGAQYQMERLGRGLVAVRQGNGYFLSWRLLGTDQDSISFNVYRGATRVNAAPVTNSTNYLDATAAAGSQYTVRPVLGGQEQAASTPALIIGGPYLAIPLQPPPATPLSSGEVYTETANDASAGDLDGDGEYEIVLKWDPSNSKDNSQAGITGPTYLDGYKLDGTRLWRINLGRNIRSGAHYTQFVVYDLDGDGKAEVSCKTADGTIDGTGKIIGDSSANYVGAEGYIGAGPEFLTIFNGQTGAAMVTTNYIPPRGNLCDWGDPNCGPGYINRPDRFLAGVAYFDGSRPSLLMCRGYYTRAVLAAWNWRDGQLTRVWTFDTRNGATWRSYEGQGNHNLRIGDVDGDGKDEVVYGACCIDNNGTGLYTTGLGHGDAMHLSDLDPDRPGLEVFQVHEGANATAGAEFRDAKTGTLIWGKPSTGDVGRGMTADITASSRGYECWVAGGGISGLFDCHGNTIGTAPSSCNFAVWWDGDLLRELENGTSISKYGGSTLVTDGQCASNNSTKSTPCLTADLLGDWREEVIWRKSDDTELRIYTTAISTSSRIYTLMHDPVYRLSVVTENVAYNQPPEPGFYLGDGMAPPPRPNIIYPGGGSAIQATGGTGEAGMRLEASPNPFKTDISFQASGVSKNKEAKLSIYNCNGKLVQVLTSDVCGLTSQYTWNASSMPSGLYIARLQAGAQVMSKRLFLLK